MLAVVLGVVALAGGHGLWAIGLIPGLLLAVLGVRIAYDGRLARGADRIRDATPFSAYLPSWYYRQVNGAVIALFGLFFIGLGAEGVASLVS